MLFHIITPCHMSVHTRSTHFWFHNNPMHSTVLQSCKPHAFSAKPNSAVQKHSALLSIELLLRCCRLSVPIFRGPFYHGFPFSAKYLSLLYLFPFQVEGELGSVVERCEYIRINKVYMFLRYISFRLMYLSLEAKLLISFLS